MSPRNTRTALPSRAPAVPMHRGPQAFTPVSASAMTTPFVHAPNAALLIDFDNVTMGIRSDLQTELRSLLSSDIIKGKVAVQRAYADWRRYPQYIVPLTESSIDLIYAPAYGSSKKNATDIRLAIDALELVFTRPEIGTFILLSGDSDFSSLVIKLKEYGKYVIGVGIRESSSDLLVMNCDEYFSYNTLAGLVKNGDEEMTKRDPWELVAEAVARMKRNGDVMRADRLKQVMQEIDASFDEKDLGMAKFSRFVQEAAQRGLVTISRLENGQLEVGVGSGQPDSASAAAAAHGAAEEEEKHPRESAENGRRGRRGGRGRGRRPAGAPAADEATEHAAAPVSESAPEPAVAAPKPAAEAAMTGERLTRDEAFSLVRQAVQALTALGEESVLATDVRHKAHELLGRDSETLSDRYFPRILRDMHDADLIDLRKRGDTYEVSPAAAPAGTVAEQLAPAPTSAGAEAGQAAKPAANAAGLRRGMRPRGPGRRGGAAAGVPPELLSVGVVSTAPAPRHDELHAAAPLAAPLAESAAASADAGAPAEAKPKAKTAAKKTRAKRATTKKTAKTAAARRPRARQQSTAAAAAGTTAAESADPPAEDGAAPAVAKAPRRPRARKKSAAPPASNT